MGAVRETDFARRFVEIALDLRHTSLNFTPSSAPCVGRRQGRQTHMRPLVAALKVWFEEA